MNTTPTTIQTALAAVMHDVSHVAKSDRNTHQNFSFRGIDAVLNAVGPALRAHGVIVLPEVLAADHQVIEMANGKSAYHVIVKVRYMFVGPAGDTLAATVVGEAMDYGDKATPKAMSVAFRTALLQSLALPTDEPDPDADTYERGPAPREAADGFGALMAGITGAVDPEALAVAVAAVQSTRAPLTPTQRDHLRRAYTERREALGTP